MFDKDPRFKQYKKVSDRVSSLIDPDELFEELLALHQSRKITKLKAKDFLRNHSRVIESTVDESSKRSRCTTIKILALRQYMVLKDADSAIRKYLSAKYAKKLKASGRTTLTAQKGYIDARLSDHSGLLDRIDMVMKTADMVIEDIDASGWGLKRISDSIDQAIRDK